MPAPGKFDEETRARVVRMYRDGLAEHGESMVEARRRSSDTAAMRGAVPRRRLGGRSAKARRAVLEAAFELAKENGLAGWFSIPTHKECPRCSIKSHRKSLPA